MKRSNRSKTIKKNKFTGAVFSIFCAIFLLLSAILSRPIDFDLIKIAQAADGFAVGSNNLIMNSGENLFYANFNASSHSSSSPILLQKPAGTNIFRVNTSGSLIMAGSLTMPAAASITNGTTYGTGVLAFYNGATSYLLFDIPNARIENKLGKFYASGQLGSFGTIDNYGLAFMVNNSEKMRFDTAGNVGIAKTGPGATLDIVGGLNSSGTINGTGLCIATDCKASWSLLVAAGGGSYWSKTAGFVYPTTISDNVGIGIISPSVKLQAFLDTNNTDIIRASTAAHSIGLGVDASGANFGSSIFQDGTKRFTVESNGGILVGGTYQTANAPANGAIIEGSVGVGLSNPAIGLTVQKDNGSGWSALFRSGPSYAGLLLGSPNNTYFRLAGFDSTLTAARDLAFNPAGGNVGFAKTNPAATLDLVGGVYATSSINATGLCIAGTCRTRWPNGVSSQWTDIASGIYYDLGNVGIKTSNPQVLLDVYATSTTASVPAPTTTSTYNNSSTGMTGTIYTWTVPTTNTYTIDAYGAQGGTPTGYTQYPGGKGARMKGDFSLTAGEVIKILVGQQGLATTYSGSGGGGTFVVKQSGNVPMVVAGGGGGSSYNGSYGLGMDAVIGTSGTNDRSGNVTGGLGGNGGNCNGSYSHAGAGFNGNGNTCSIGGTMPYSYINGGVGGSANSTQGGFGGGGSAYNSSYCGGGGGGYSGGAGGYSSNNYGGGGGGSYNAGTNQSNTAGYNSGQGRVIITAPGIGMIQVTTQGQAANFSGYGTLAGSIKVGDPGSDCNSQTEGMIKYSTTTRSFLGCDGVGWQNFISQ
jgi:hypothetical protein